ncbi:MAG TPA: NAD(P)-dependent oxidoreductase [Candidatus Hydrogenedentes bacterium]|nr:NAD(P)-dependent oxidoreductase [Candidatus Hydrogenedentota bacterium]HRT18729.1 NAD(P)-dependent oxidoreductase [Candidatus Hydrogenedentota bacterium]HRT63749.1 NAD(P)-dependent oxidoreductase [Candidatus Hydrogenedentota bacterium]
MRILVTGSTGLIGEAVAAHLAGQGHEVFGLSRKPATADGPTVPADISAPDFSQRVMDAIPPCAAVVHSAASLGMRNDDPSVALTNCLGTQQVVTLAARWEAKCFVYLSSVAVIGRPCHVPIDETHPVDPQTVYAASKLFGEHVCALSGMPAALLRVTAPIGPRMPRNRILPLFLSKARMNEPLLLNGKGTRRQNYVDVRDIARAVEACIGRAASGVYFIAGNESVTNRELAERCIRAVQSKSKIEFSGNPDPDDDIAWDICIAKAARDLGYRPHYSLDASIADIAAAL